MGKISEPRSKANVPITFHLLGDPATDLRQEKEGEIKYDRSKKISVPVCMWHNCRTDQRKSTRLRTIKSQYLRSTNSSLLQLGLLEQLNKTRI